MDKKIKNSPIGYIIPQMEDNDVGIRSFEKKFESTDFVSPLFGDNVKDTLGPFKTEAVIDVDNDYDVYRREKRISEAELIKKHGTKYPEFDGVESQLDDYKPKTEVKQKEEPKVKLNFDIV